MPRLKNRYLSILKQKAGEVDAVRDLASSIWAQWNPLFELLSGELDEEESVSDLITRLVHGVKRSCKPGTTIFLDFEGVELPDTGGSPVVAQVLAQIAALGYEVVPVVHLFSSPDIRSAYAQFLQTNGGCCASRLYLSDLTPQLNEQASSLSAQLDMTIEESFLLIDVEEIPANYVVQLGVVLGALVPLIPRLADWSSVTVVGTGIPRILDIPAGSNAVLPRTEWELFTQASPSLRPLVRRLDFGDYTISNPELIEFDPVTMQVSPKILYTTDDSWVAYKGRSTRRHSWDQTHGMCALLAARPEFRGAGFSRGDEYIAQCAVRAVSRGNGRTWKRVGTNHHLTFVAGQVANLFGS